MITPHAPSGTHHTDTVVLAVAYVYIASAVHVDTVRPGQAALQRVAVGPVVARPVPRESRSHARALSAADGDLDAG